MNTNDIASSGAGDLVDRTVEVVSAYVSNNSFGTGDVAKLIGEVHRALAALTAVVPGPGVEELKPAVPVRKSVMPDYIVCLEDGKKFKSLKRHLRTTFDMSPEEYREKWNLPNDYPMVAPNYSATRSNLAKSYGLGRKPAPVAVANSPAKSRRSKVVAS